MFALLRILIFSGKADNKLLDYTSRQLIGVQNRSSDFELHYEEEAFINDLLRKDMKQTKLDDFLSK